VKHQIKTPSREAVYMQEVDNTVIYFLLRKIKATYMELMDELKITHDNLEEEMILQTSLLELKRNEIALLEQFRTVLAR